MAPTRARHSCTTACCTGRPASYVGAWAHRCGVPNAKDADCGLRTSSSCLDVQFQSPRIIDHRLSDLGVGGWRGWRRRRRAWRGLSAGGRERCVGLRLPHDKQPAESTRVAHSAARARNWSHSGRRRHGSARCYVKTPPSEMKRSRRILRAGTTPEGGVAQFESWPVCAGLAAGSWQLAARFGMKRACWRRHRASPARGPGKKRSLISPQSIPRPSLLSHHTLSVRPRVPWLPTASRSTTTNCPRATSSSPRAYPVSSPPRAFHPDSPSANRLVRVTPTRSATRCRMPSSTLAWPKTPTRRLPARLPLRREWSWCLAKSPPRL